MSEASSHDLDAAVVLDHRLEARKEAYAMALYVAICLLAALAAVSEATARNAAFKIVWGTTIGLALAHLFAFLVSARLVAAGEVRRHDAHAAVAQLIGATAVGLLATIPVLFSRDAVEAVQMVLACLIGLVGYAVAHSGGASHGRAFVYAACLLVVAAIVVVVKSVLSGH